MKRTVGVLLALLALLAVPVEAQSMDLFLIPIETVGNRRGPKYFCWGMGPPTPGCIAGGFAMMDYGFSASGLVLARDLSAADRTDLLSYADVFAFPENLDGSVDQDVQAFFEDIHLPTDWLTPATTWLELLRQTAGMFQFNQRYGGIAAAETGEIHSIFDTATLDTRLRQMTAQEQSWFLATVASFGQDPNAVNDNNQLRLLVRQAGDLWEGQPFYLGGIEF